MVARSKIAAEVDEERVVTRAREDLAAARQRLDALRGDLLVVGRRAGADVDRRHHQVAGDDLRLLVAALAGDLRDRVGLVLVEVRVVDRGDDAGRVQERRPPDVRREAEQVRRVVDRVAVGVDVDAVAGGVRELVEVRPVRRILLGDPVGDDRDRVRLVGRHERVQVRVVRRGVLRDERRLGVARGLGLLRLQALRGQADAECGGDGQTGRQGLAGSHDGSSSSYPSPWGDAGAGRSAERPERFDRSEDPRAPAYPGRAVSFLPLLITRLTLPFEGRTLPAFGCWALTLPSGVDFEVSWLDLADHAVRRVQRAAGGVEGHAEGARDDARRRRERRLGGRRELGDLGLRGRAGVAKLSRTDAARRDVAGVLQPERGGVQQVQPVGDVLERQRAGRCVRVVVGLGQAAPHQDGRRGLRGLRHGEAGAEHLPGAAEPGEGERRRGAVEAVLVDDVDVVRLAVGAGVGVGHRRGAAVGGLHPGPVDVHRSRLEDRAGRGVRRERGRRRGAAQRRLDVAQRRRAGRRVDAQRVGDRRDALRRVAVDVLREEGALAVDEQAGAAADVVREPRRAGRQRSGSRTGSPRTRSRCAASRPRPRRRWRGPRAGSRRR